LSSVAVSSPTPPLEFHANNNYYVLCIFSSIAFDPTGISKSEESSNCTFHSLTCHQGDGPQHQGTYINCVCMPKNIVCSCSHFKVYTCTGNIIIVLCVGGGLLSLFFLTQAKSYCSGHWNCRFHLDSLAVTVLS
jgi:hypothetical protein